MMAAIATTCGEAMAVEVTTSVIVRTTIRARTTTRRAPRTGRLSSSAPKKPAMARAASRTSSHVPDSSVTVSPGGYSTDEHADQSFGDACRGRSARDRQPPTRAAGVRHVPPARRPPRRFPSRRGGRSRGRPRTIWSRRESGERQDPRVGSRTSAPGPAGRIAPARAIGRTGSGCSVRNCGASPAPQAIVASESCGQVSDSTALPVTTTVTGRFAGIRSSSEPNAARVRPGLAWALATLTPLSR